MPCGSLRLMRKKNVESLMLDRECSSMDIESGKPAGYNARSISITTLVPVIGIAFEAVLTMKSHIASFLGRNCAFWIQTLQLLALINIKQY